MPSDKLPPPAPVPAEARAVALTWAPPPRDMIEPELLDRLFGPCETVDPGPLVAELSSLRADLRTLATTHGWYDEEDES